MSQNLPIPDGPAARARREHGMVHVDPVKRQAELDPQATYSALLEAALPYGLAPRVVPTPTSVRVGLAAQVLGAGSSSFRNGTVRDELSGRARPGSGGGATLRLALEPIRPYVHLRHVRLGSAGQLVALLEQLEAARSGEGEEVSFAEGLAVGHLGMFLTLGSWTGQAPFAHSYRWGRSYGRSVRSRLEDYLTVRDYLRRWDLVGWLAPMAAPLAGAVGAVRAAGWPPQPRELALPVPDLVARSTSAGARPLRFWPLPPTPGQASRVAVRLG